MILFHTSGLQRTGNMGSRPTDIHGFTEVMEYSSTYCWRLDTTDIPSRSQEELHET